MMHALSGEGLYFDSYGQPPDLEDIIRYATAIAGHMTPFVAPDTITPSRDPGVDENTYIHGFGQMKAALAATAAG